MLSLKKMKKWQAAVFLAVLAFLIVNIVWFVSVYTGYLNDKTGMTKDGLGDYYCQEDDYDCYIYAPRYLGRAYNITIGRHETPEEGVNVSLIIWPTCKENEKYGILLESVDSDKIYEQIYVNENMEPIYSLSKADQKIFNAKKDEIERLRMIYHDHFANS